MSAPAPSELPSSRGYRYPTEVIARRPAPDDNFWRIATVPGETWSACQRRPDRDRSLVGASTLTLLSDANNLP